MAVCKTFIPGSNPGAHYYRRNPTKPVQTRKNPGSNPFHRELARSRRHVSTRMNPARSVPATASENASVENAYALNSDADDPDLAAVVDHRPELPEAIKAGILAMVKTASGNS